METENNIRAARSKLGFTQSEMACALGVNLSTVWRWEKGLLPVRPVVAAAVERLLSEAAKTGERAA